MRWLPVVLALLVACGPSPEAESARPTGTLVIVIRQGPERVPFRPKVDRIRRANEQLAAILGHSIQIELDGSLLPQDHDGAEDVIARLVEAVAQDLDALKKEDGRALPFAAANFERLVVRYSPTDAAARSAESHRRHLHALFDKKEKTIDVALAEARWLALERGDVAAPLITAFEGEQNGKYAHVLPDALPARERRAWLEYHTHYHRADAAPDQVVGSVDALRVRGMVMLANDGDPDARKELIESELDNFATTYHHAAPQVEAAAPNSPYRQAETAFMGWLKAAIPSMSVAERAKVAKAIWVTDFRKNNGERDRFATYSFPGLDPMAFSFAQVDAWIAAGHPTKEELFDLVVTPVHIESKNGETRYQHDGRGDGELYKWALASPAREETFARALLQRVDAPFTISAFYNAHSALREETEYLRFLRRFETQPVQWKVGADVLRSMVFRPSNELLEESRRQWREVPAARGHALFYFARHAEGSYNPETDWVDMLQGQKPDDSALAATLDLGWQAFELLPVMWRVMPRTSGRIKITTDHAHTLLEQDIRPYPGHHDVAGLLADVAAMLCDSPAELAELQSFAQRELAARPGAGLSNVIEATDPAKCKPTPARKPPPPRKPTRPKWKEGDPLPPKDPF